MGNQKQIQRLLDAATSVLKLSSESARLDAELLMCHVLEQDRTYLFTWSDKEISESQLQAFNAALARRQKGEPIAHITGLREFWSLEFEVSPATLIPRPDTEILVEAALEYASSLEAKASEPANYRGLDLGTGTGAIALSLASELPHWQWVGVDLVPEAVELARRNANRNAVDNCELIQSSWFDNVPKQTFDLIVSNPPYIDPQDEHLQIGDVRFEPLSALTAEQKGLADIATIIEKAVSYLTPSAPIFIEHGYNQADDVQTLFIQLGYQNVRTIKDLSGKDRVTVGYFQ
ncbi:MAG: peptide chain release factor N(5)-glutamine methyltransferase [Gammaproteobacteria bacterium]|nr:peptide chain release factor N(5)-glutamine methyltransferase [Gammaproteobacteria bacterium]